MAKVNERVEPLDGLNAAMEVEGVDLEDGGPDDAVILNQLMGAAEEVRNARKVRIIMHNQEGNNGDQAVFVACNGMGYSIPRETPVIVPEPILKALEDAVETKYYREEQNGQFVGPMLERHVRRFPFSVLG